MSCINALAFAFTVYRRDCGGYAAAGLTVTDVSEYTGHHEIMHGRVKTLHPKVHGGIMSVRGNPSHEADKAAQGIQDIDLVVLNL